MLVVTNITLDSAYIISDNGQKLDMAIGTPPEAFFPSNKINPIPQDTKIMMKADFGALTEEDFLKTWGNFRVIIKYSGKSIEHEYSKEWVAGQFTRYYMSDPPYISGR